MGQRVALAEAAVRAGHPPARMFAVLTAGLVTGRKVGRHWMIDEASLDRYLATRGVAQAAARA